MGRGAGTGSLRCSGAPVALAAPRRRWTAAAGSGAHAQVWRAAARPHPCEQLDAPQDALGRRARAAQVLWRRRWGGGGGTFTSWPVPVRRMEHGAWSTALGAWRMVQAAWRMAHGPHLHGDRLAGVQAAGVHPVHDGLQVDSRVVHRVAGGVCVCAWAGRQAGGGWARGARVGGDMTRAQAALLAQPSQRGPRLVP